MQRLRVEADQNDLVALQRMVLHDPDNGLEVQEITRMEPGALNEPILTGVVIVGVTKAAAKLISRWLEHREKLKEASNLRLVVLIEGQSKEISIEDLKKLERAAG
jgi:hypothetical protein